MGDDFSRADSPLMKRILLLLGDGIIRKYRDIEFCKIGFRIVFLLEIFVFNFWAMEIENLINFSKNKWIILGEILFLRGPILV